MVQLIINGDIQLPKTSHDRYKCYEAPLKQKVEMISGRVVFEVRGYVQKIEYSYDYMGNDLCRKVLSVLRGRQEFSVVYLPDSGDEMQTGVFVCENLTEPTFAFSRSGKPYWHNLAFTLREVSPHA